MSEELTVSIIRSPSLDMYTTMGNKDVRVLYPVVGGLAIEVGDRSITIPSAQLGQFARWLLLVDEKLPAELTRCSKFEHGE
jgi:hypothetical protein